MERRFVPIELRAAGGRTLEGYAAVWDQPARIEGRFTETVKQGAFRGTLAAGEDVALLVDHDPGRLLARTRSGTLALAEDGHGLRFTAALPQTQLADDVLELVRRGDVGGASFGFLVPPGGDAWPTKDRRELRSVQLAECSIVHFRPAYEGTSVAARMAGRMTVRAARVRLARL